TSRRPCTGAHVDVVLSLVARRRWLRTAAHALHSGTLRRRLRARWLTAHAVAVLGRTSRVRGRPARVVDTGAPGTRDDRGRALRDRLPTGRLVVLRPRVVPHRLVDEVIDRAIEVVRHLLERLP